MSNKIINIYNMLPETTALGPGVRFALWLQGCDKRCDGCLSPRSHSLTGGRQYKISELINIISEIKNIEGLTISGGEPLLQSESLSELIMKLREKKDYGIILYTGYRYEEIEEKAEKDINLKNLIQQVDLLIDGPYIKELDDGKSLRGSSNQKVISLTGRYAEFMHLYGREGRKVEMFFDEDKISFAGVPSEVFLLEWENKFK